MAEVDKILYYIMHLMQISSDLGWYVMYVISRKLKSLGILGIGLPFLSSTKALKHQHNKDTCAVMPGAISNCGKVCRGPIRNQRMCQTKQMMQKILQKICRHLDLASLNSKGSLMLVLNPGPH